MTFNINIPFADNLLNQFDGLFLVSNIDSENNWYELDLSSYVMKTNVKAGITAKFYGSDKTLLITGYVIKVENNVAYCLPAIPNPDIWYIKLEPAWKANITTTEILSTNCFVFSSGQTANLSAKARSLENSYIVWDLYYDNELVIKGNDYNSPGVINYSKANNLWKAGKYLLLAQIIHKTVVYKQDEVIWTLNQSSNTLSCGGYNDTLALLFL